ncbi:MAG TPA: FAD-dependent oxidoreductase [bacterium]|nr:FAD-dependent oxidoreductase [bacterium]
MYDVIIIGAGPAGMTAAIYCARRAMKVLVVSKEMGGQAAKTFLIENYPGLKSVDGVELVFAMKAQVESLGVEIVTGVVEKIEKIITGGFEVTSAEKHYLAKTIIIATGLVKKKLGVLNEEKYDGRGLSYCINCDGPLFKDKTVAVVGGGNSGAEAVEFLAKICPQIYWLEITDQLRADAVLLDIIKKMSNVEILLQTKVTALNGDGMLSSITIDKNGAVLEKNTQGVFVEIGYQAQTEWLKEVLNLDSLGQIKVDELGHTSCPGIFAAGDVTKNHYKQIVVAEGMGAIAALEAYKFILNQK